MKLPRLEDLDRSTYATLVLALLLAAAWLGARGLESHVDLRRRLSAAHAQQEALSPLAYRKPLPALSAALGADARGRWTTVVRVDADESALDQICALARESSPPVRFLALSDDTPACVAPEFLIRAGLATSETRTAIETEMRTARWVIVDDAGRARYSRRTPPTPDELLRTIATFDTRPTTQRLVAGDAGDTGGARRAAAWSDATPATSDGGETDAGKRRSRVIRTTTPEPAA